MSSGYRSVPAFVHEQIQVLATSTFYVGRVREYTRPAVSSGILEHLGITWVGETPELSESTVIPPADRGRWSKRNVEGWVKVRKDLQKYDKTVGVWSTPNFGDPSRGYHTYYSVRAVYPREIWWGQGLAIRVELNEVVGDTVRIGFIVDRVFDRADLEDRNLWMACSLLRENIDAHAGVLSTNTPVSEWLRTQRVTWELLPVGEREPRPFSEIANRLRLDRNSPRVRRMAERYDVAHSWRPTDIVVGDGEFSRYIGFKYRDDLVALESLDYGNALYLMYEDWQTLSQRTRIDLLSDTIADFDRVVHSNRWEERLASHLRAKGLHRADA